MFPIIHFICTYTKSLTLHFMGYTYKQSHSLHRVAPCIDNIFALIKNSLYMNPNITCVLKLTIVDAAATQEHGSDAGVNNRPWRPGRPGSTPQTPGLAPAITRPDHGHAMAPACTNQPHACTGTYCTTHIDGEGTTKGSVHPTMRRAGDGEVGSNRGLG
jgi:hypothetical protein